MNESATKETGGKDRELSDEEMDEAQVSGGTGNSASEGKLSAEEAERLRNHGWRNEVWGTE